MDNFFPFSSSNANSVQEFAMDANNNLSHLLYSYPMEQMAAVMNPHQPLYSSDAFPQIPVSQPGSEVCSLVSNPNPCLRPERGGLFLDPTKMARINRKNAMIRSRNNSSPNSSPDEVVESKRQVMMLNMRNNVQIPERKDLYPHSTFDNKKLRVSCVKLLKNSDVGALGRIVLPKREAEGKLPKLSDKEGIVLEMRDVFSLQSWSFKYKFWSNNKSRMYVLENTGEFVRQNGVESGDTLTIYEDESKNLPGRQNGGRGAKSMEVNERNHYEEIMYDFMPGDEEEASIAMLIGNLNDHYPNPNDLMGLTVDHQHYQAASSLLSVDYAHVGSLDDQVSFDDIVW
ncbi:PREDICTED: B3 domain-containing transcription factor LEC2-like isoform X2 [Camelina sativa]|uniref:B3 domain-containing transcription factor LEC2-like isoform X2 n=1 Tax=Camelina sativa TaxID=90675 RepID=A0ABM1R724_CAMSA|nr:PREDICTED: B3 domain-containing transcription factor LEC2-like isoform X2 [Camelina sativa]